ncbi:MAG: hypothetical protein IT290_06850, partial [Deltaproteobacteria bacterium]|nr:hypothetical protein [Deltaproteobacteria bacterium]
MRLASFLVLLIPLLVFVTVGDAEAQFRCPAGTEVVGSPPPDGTELFCAKGQKGATIKHGPYRSWYERGGAKKIEGNFTNGEKDGLFTTWYDRAGKMRREVFMKGYRHGKAEMWYKNGQPRLSEEFENGKKHGTRRGWYKDGNPSYHIEVSHGRNVGAFQQWYRQNKRKIAGFFDTESKKTGIWTIWDKQGQRVSEGPYVAGKREGKWTFWSNDGSIHGVTHFKAGKIVRTTIPDYNADKRDKNGKKIKRKKGVKDSKRKPRGRKTSDETPKNSRRIGESDEIDLDDESLKESSPDDVENKAEREELDDLETPI